MEGRPTINPEGSACYLCGPYGAVSLFNAAARTLEDAGAHVIDPSQCLMRGGINKGDRFAANIVRLVKEADILVLLPGWEYDGMACVERMLAKELGMLVCDIGDIEGD